MINQELGKKWVAALRSGEYKQGTGALRFANDKFCCVGVLCDIVDHTKWQSTSFNAEKPYFAWVTDVDNQTGCIPPTVHEAIGESLKVGELYNMNDEQRKTFTEIADFIESKYLLPDFKS